MTRYTRPAIGGEPPWGRNAAGIDDHPREPVPKQNVAYDCERCGTITRPYAADAVPPAAVSCRCGKTARLPGAPGHAKPETPKYGPPAYREKGRLADDISPWAQLMKRRSIPQLEALLAERLTAMRGRMS